MSKKKSDAKAIGAVVKFRTEGSYIGRTDQVHIVKGRPSSVGGGDVEKIRIYEVKGGKDGKTRFATDFELRVCH